MDRGEAVWLRRLAEFDDEGEWAADGHYSCVDWLEWRLKMARSNAYEKLQVAHELRRRPVIAAAFEAGRLSYSATGAELLAVFLGRKEIPGIRTGTQIVLTGTVGDRRGRLAMLNPMYELLAIPESEAAAD
jgi:hypothetical protein